MSTEPTEQPPETPTVKESPFKQGEAVLIPATVRRILPNGTLICTLSNRTNNIFTAEQVNKAPEIPTV